MEKVRHSIETKIREALQPEHLEVINESHKHKVAPGSESHFKLLVVSAAFENQSLLERHRCVNSLLAEELSTQVHALALHTLTPCEWSAKDKQTWTTPPCLSGSTPKSK